MFGLEKITDIAKCVYESENVPNEMIESCNKDNLRCSTK